jgi:hypothetical protein
MKIHFAKQMNRQKCTIHMLCQTFLIIYTFRAIFSVFLGSYREGIVCSAEIRWFLLDTFDFVFNFVPVICVLYFHHQSFKCTDDGLTDRRSRTEEKLRSTEC